MIKSITYHDILTAAVAEQILLEQQKTKKSNGVYELPKQADDTYFIKYNDAWYYVYFDADGRLSRKAVKPAQEKKLERQARFSRNLTDQEIEIYQGKTDTRKVPAFTYQNDDGELETVANVTKPEVSVTRHKLTMADKQLIARNIWDAKGAIWDSESLAINGIARINTQQDYDDINEIFSTQYSGGRDITTYLKSFLSISDRCSIAALLRTKVQPYILTDLVTYADAKRVVAWVSRNYENSVINSFSDTDWNADAYNRFKSAYFDGYAPSVQEFFDIFNSIIQFYFPGGDIKNVPKEYQKELLWYVTTKKTLSIPDRIAQSFASWTNDGAKMVWKYLTDINLYYDEFAQDLQTYDASDAIAHLSAAVLVSDPMSYDELMTSLRDKVYSTEGIATTIILDKIPGVNFVIKAVFILLAVHDVYRITQGDYWALLELVFDLLGILGAEQIAAVLKPIVNVIKRIITFLRRGKVITSTLKEAVKTALKSLGTAISNFLKTLTGIDIGQLISNSIQYIKDNVVSLLEKAGFAQIADAIKQRLINFKTNVVTLYNTTIGQFFKFINECLVELVGETAAPVVKSTATAITGLVLIDNAINWVGSEIAKQEMEQLNQKSRAQNDEMLDQAMQKRYGRDWKTEVCYFAYKYPLLLYRRQRINGKVEFKKYISWNPESDNTKSYAPIMLAGQSAESGYMRVNKMYTDATRTKQVFAFNDLHPKAINDYIYIKIDDVWQFNKQPLNTYSWYKIK